MPKLPKPQAILFDWDNTLVDSWPVIHTALNITLDAMGHPRWTMEQTRASVHKSMRDAFPAMFKERWEEAAKIYQDAYRARNLTEIKPLPDAEQTVRLASGGGEVLVGVVSNKRGDNLRKEISAIGWDGHFARVVGANDAEHDKPHPAPVLMALKDTGIHPGPDVWFVGDSVVDVECARATGCTPVFFSADRDVPWQRNYLAEAGYHDVHCLQGHPELGQLMQAIFSGK